MWYVIQTTTGKERELVEQMRVLLPKEIYKDCFFLKRKLLKRLGGRWTVVTETLFPSYIFMITDRPEALFYELKQIPQFSKILGNGDGVFIPLENGEEEFLEKLCRDCLDRTVALSEVSLDRDGEIQKITGPLHDFKGELMHLNLRKRYAVVKFPLGGVEQKTILGICLDKDRK